MGWLSTHPGSWFCSQSTLWSPRPAECHAGSLHMQRERRAFTKGRGCGASPVGEGQRATAGDIFQSPRIRRSHISLAFSVLRSPLATHARISPNSVTSSAAVEMATGSVQEVTFAVRKCTGRKRRENRTSVDKNKLKFTFQPGRCSPRALQC